MFQIGEIHRTLDGARDRLISSHVSRLWVFGSVARGEACDNSDIDMLVQLDEAPVGFLAIVRLKALLEEILPREVDLIDRAGLYGGWSEKILGEAVLVFDGG